MYISVKDLVIASQALASIDSALESSPYSLFSIRPIAVLWISWLGASCLSR